MNVLMQKYRILGKKGEGTFSEVLKCQNMKDGTYWACKKMKQHYDSVDSVNNLREIQAMKRLSPHLNILELQEVIFDKRSGILVLVSELMDMNIYELIRDRRQYLPEQKIKSYMYQLCKSIEHMHKNGIFHRDVKPENILIKDDNLKLADFGSCRSVYSKQPYTEYISTRWYRAPECLLTDGYYTYKMDIWSVGCVMFEVMSLHPLFPGANEVDQINKIHEVIGTPEPAVLNKFKNKTRGMNVNFPTKKGNGIDRLLNHASADSIDLILQMCTYDPDERITARSSLKHSYFREFRDQEKRQQQLIIKSSKLEEKDTQSTNSFNKPSQAAPVHVKTEVPKTDISIGPTINNSGSAPKQQAILLQERRKRRKRYKRISDGSYAHSSMLPKIPAASSSAIYHHGFGFQKVNSQTNNLLPTVNNSYKTSKPKASTQPSKLYGYEVNTGEDGF